MKTEITTVSLSLDIAKTWAGGRSIAQALTEEANYLLDELRKKGIDVEAIPPRP